jgi:hypothetical protein
MNREPKRGRPPGGVYNEPDPTDNIFERKVRCWRCDDAGTVVKRTRVGGFYRVPCVCRGSKP